MSQNQVEMKPGQFLTFLLKSQQYGVPIEAVREINQMCDVAPVPRTPSFVLGVINLRGKVIPVVDLRVKFGMEKGKVSRSTCIVVIEGDTGQIGMVVDAVQEVIELSAAQMEPPPVLGNEAELAFVKGMGKVDNRVYILVDVIQALSKDEFTRLMEIRGDAAA